MIAVVLVCIAAAGLVGALLVLGRTPAELRMPKPLAAGVRISTASLRGVWTAAVAVRPGRSGVRAEPDRQASADAHVEPHGVTEHDVELAVRERLYGARRRGSDDHARGTGLGAGQ